MSLANREQSFPSKIDTWLVVVIAGAFLTGPVIVIADHLADGTTPEIGLVVTVVTLLAILVPACLFVVWVFRTTDYTITATELLVRAGPMRWNVPLKDIREIRSTRSLLSAPALSLDRIEVIYGKYGSVVISPEDRMGFVHTLCARAPSTIVSGIEP
jgi:hypothetical protein